MQQGPSSTYPTIFLPKGTDTNQQHRNMFIKEILFMLATISQSAEESSMHALKKKNFNDHRIHYAVIFQHYYIQKNREKKVGIMNGPNEAHGRLLPRKLSSLIAYIVSYRFSQLMEI